MEINLTKAGILALPAAAPGKRAYYHDSKIRGLCVAVTDRGTRTFQLYRWVQGRPERVTLGRFPDLTVEQARKMAEEANSLIARGNNPADSRRKALREATLQELFDRYLELHAKPCKKSWAQDERQFKTYLRDWKTRKLSHFRKSDIQELHARLGRDHGTYTANRLLALLHTMFKKAGEWGRDGKNPCQGVKKFPERTRERFLKADELPRFFEALAAEPDATLRDFFTVAILTGARRANIQEMRWEDVHLDRGEWVIPDTKNGQALTVTLTRETVTILTGRPRAGSFVFPGHGKTGHLVSPKSAWKRILERAGIKDLRIHDLRRTLGSWQAAQGASLTIIGKSLGHRDISTTAIYSRLTMDPVRDSVGRATRAILSAGGVLPAGEVLDIAKGRRS